MAALYRDVYDDVVRCAQRKRERDTLRRRLDSALGQLSAQRHELTRLAAELAREEDDIRKLAGRSFLALVARLAGSRERRLDARRQQSIATRLRHDAQQQTVDALTDEVEQLERELLRYDGIDEEYQRVFLDKAHDLVARGGPTGSRVASLSAELVAAREHVAHLNEAITAGHATLRALVTSFKVLTSDDPFEDSWDRMLFVEGRAERHLGDAQTWAFRFARALDDLVPHSSGGPGMTDVAELLLHYVEDLIRNAAREWSPSRTRAAMDGLRNYVDLQLHRLETTRARVVQTHDATESRYIEVVALG